MIEASFNIGEHENIRRSHLSPDTCSRNDINFIQERRTRIPQLIKASFNIEKYINYIYIPFNFTKDPSNLGIAPSSDIY